MNAKLSEFKAAISSNPLENAFSGRQPMMPWLSMRPIPERDVAQTWEHMRGTASAGPTVAYVHIPFCANHCLFCGFYRNSSRGNFSRQYAERVIEEIEMETQFPLVRSTPVQAIYLGGGTPTELDAEDLSRILTALRAKLPLAEDCEITVEGRAKGFTTEKIAACLDAGATRFSIGAQSFSTSTRKRLGRYYDGEALADFLRSLAAQAGDRAEVVCDLIYGLPGQTMEEWRRDLDIASNLGLAGIDLYCLSVIPGSPLQSALEKKNNFPRAGTLPEQAVRYRYGVEFFEKLGWKQISGAHWAANERERNVYNHRIKAGANCHGFGSGAGGSSGPLNYLVASSLQAYLETGPDKPIGGLFTSGPMYHARARVTDGFERGVLNLDTVYPEGAADFLNLAQPLLQQWQEAGLLTLEGQTARLTLAGQFWHTNLAAGLHASLNILGILSESPAQKTNKPSMKETDNTDTLNALRQRLAKNSDGILEMLAETNGVTTRDVVGCLPESCRTAIPGDRFAEIMEDVTSWGEILLIVHTKDGVFECAGPLPSGSFGRGFFNFSHGSPIKGHIRADHCTEIVFVRRPFMGKETCSIQFFNAEGGTMFKIFIGRDTEGNLRKDQIEKFEALRGTSSEIRKAA